MNIIAKHLTRICTFYSLRGTLVFVGIVFSQLLYAQRVTTTNEKGTKFTTGNTVTEVATAPTTPAPIQGDIWFDTTNNLYKVWDGTVWKTVVSTASLEPWFGTDDNAAATDNTEDIYVMGNVGIGTVSPTFKLEVAGAESDALINSVRVGKGAGDINSNTVVGQNALSSNTTAWNSVAIGMNALQSQDTAGGNTGVGVNTLQNNTGNNNVAVGASTLQSQTTAAHNVAVGGIAAANITTGGQNTGVGAFAMSANTTAGLNTAIGYAALPTNVTGHRNVAIGVWAGGGQPGLYPNITNTENSIYIGKDSRPQGDNQTNQIVIGIAARGIGSNTVVLGNDAVVTTALKGNVGIGTTTPTDKLDVNGTARVRTLNAGDAATDQVVVADATGVLKKVAVTDIGAPETTTTLVQDDATGVITYTNEDGTASTAEIISVDADNLLTVGADGGAFIDQSAIDEPWFSETTNVGATLNTENIYSLGNVGIGTTTPTYKLEVSGANSDALINGVRVGRGAGDIATNTVVGNNALANATAGNNNAFGNSALVNLTSGQGNNAFGISALAALTTGIHNIGIGNSAVAANESGNFNIGIGTSALINATLHSNVAIGGNSQAANTTGQRNVSLGYGTLQNLSTGNDNVAVGYQAGRYLPGNTLHTTGSTSIFIGREAKPDADDQFNQIVIGHTAEGIGSNTVVLGNDAVVTTALKGNVGIGTVLPTDKLDVNGRVRVRTLDTGDTFTDNVVLVNADGVFKKVPVAAVGTPEPWFGVDDNAPATSNTEDMYVIGNVGIGTATPAYKLEVAGANSDALINGVRVGKGAGDVDTNTAVGANTLMNNTIDGTRNTAVGYQALMNITTGDNNVAMGYNALNQIVGGHENVAIGNRAMENNISGGANVAMGYFALTDNTSGVRNTAIGGLALQRNTIGNDNIAIGTTAGAKIINGGIDNTVAYQSIYIGNGTEPQLSNQTNQIIIGYQAEGIGSNSVVLGNDAVVTTALKGNVGIGNTSPNANAILDLSNTASKVLLLPTVAPGTVSGATDGMITFDSSNNNAYLRANGAWKPLSYNTVTNELIFNGEAEGSGTYDDYYYVSLVQNGNWKVVRYHKTNPNDETTANVDNNPSVTLQPTTVTGCVSLTFL